MCVICYTNDVNISDDVLKKMWDANPDGAGFAYITEKNVCKFSKGFMKFEELIEALPKNRQYLMLHFRIGTSGAKTKAYTHPFDIEKIEKLSGNAKRLVFHNGIVNIDWNESQEDIAKHSDTYLLARDVLKHIKNENVYSALLNGSGSRFAVYDENIDKGMWTLYGKWVEWEGLTVSNTNFNITSAKYTPRYSSAYSGESYDYWEDADRWNGWQKSGESRWTRTMKSESPIEDIEEPDDTDSVFNCRICGDKLNEY